MWGLRYRGWWVVVGCIACHICAKTVPEAYVVEENLARLRFFVTSGHSEADLQATADAVSEELIAINPRHLVSADAAAAKARVVTPNGTTLAHRVVDGVKVFDLETSVIGWFILPTEQVAAYAYNRQVPGPRLRATQGDRVVSRFRTHKTGALLAYLAFHLHRSHSREALIELFWPESPPELGRASLRKALSSLRHQLEPPGVPEGAVILADRETVQFNPAAVTTDVAAVPHEIETLALPPMAVSSTDIRARAGVLTGEAAVTIGATNQGLVAGDLVNTAARLQSVAEPATVLVAKSFIEEGTPGSVVGTADLYQITTTPKSELDEAYYYFTLSKHKHLSAPADKDAEKTVDISQLSKCLVAWQCQRPNIAFNESKLFDKHFEQLFRPDYAPADILSLVRWKAEIDKRWNDNLGLQEDLDLLTHLREGPHPMKLLDRDRALALVADVDEDLARAHVDDAALDDLAFLELAHRLMEPVLHALLGCVGAALLARIAEGVPGFMHAHTCPFLPLPVIERAPASAAGLPAGLPPLSSSGGAPPAVSPMALSRRRRMASIIIRLAVSYRVFLSSPSWRSNRRAGPNRTVTFAGRGRRRPRGQARPLPAMYTGTTGAPLSTASMPAPALAGRNSPSSPRVPSGNTSRARFSSSMRRAVRKALGSAPSRRSGRAFSCQISRPNSGMRKSSALARKESGRAATPPTSGGSSTLEWFATGRVFSASEGLKHGLFSEVVSPERLLPRAYAN